jgi:hypothetical protein
MTRKRRVNTVLGKRQITAQTRVNVHGYSVPSAVRRDQRGFYLGDPQDQLRRWNSIGYKAGSNSVPFAADPKQVRYASGQVEFGQAGAQTPYDSNPWLPTSNNAALFRGYYPVDLNQQVRFYGLNKLDPVEGVKENFTPSVTIQNPLVAFTRGDSLAPPQMTNQPFSTTWCGGSGGSIRKPVGGLQTPHEAHLQTVSIAGIGAAFMASEGDPTNGGVVAFDALRPTDPERKQARDSAPISYTRPELDHRNPAIQVNRVQTYGVPLSRLASDTRIYRPEVAGNSVSDEKGGAGSSTHTRLDEMKDFIVGDARLPKMTPNPDLLGDHEAIGHLNKRDNKRLASDLQDERLYMYSVRRRV